MNANSLKKIGLKYDEAVEIDCIFAIKFKKVSIEKKFQKETSSIKIMHHRILTEWGRIFRDCRFLESINEF